LPALGQGKEEKSEIVICPAKKMNILHILTNRSRTNNIDWIKQYR
jgi:hypothetical protein